MDESRFKDTPPAHVCPCCRLSFNDLVLYIKHLRGMRTAVDRALVVADAALDAVKVVKQ